MKPQVFTIIKKNRRQLKKLSHNWTVLNHFLRFCRAPVGCSSETCDAVCENILNRYDGVMNMLDLHL